MPNITNTDTPACKRIIAALENRGPLDRKQISEFAFVGYASAHNYMFLLHRDKKVHIHGYRLPEGGGFPIRIWAAGEGKDAVYKKKDPKVRHRQWIKSLQAKYGTLITSRMVKGRNHGGADVIVLEGQVIYRRKAGLGRNKAAA